MIVGKIQLLSLAASILATGLMLTPGLAEANPRTIVTECEPFQPYPGANHQRCTRYHYSSNGTLLFTSVYYIDENGVWYRLAD